MSEGDHVVLYPSDALRDGIKVVPQPQEPRRSEASLVPDRAIEPAAEAANEAVIPVDETAPASTGSGAVEGSAANE